MILFNMLSVDEETIVRGAVGLAAPIGGVNEDGTPGRVWGPIELMENGRRGPVACRACARDIARDAPAIRFGITTSRPHQPRPAYLHAEPCRA